MSDPWQISRETGVTIKYGKGYEDTWVTFRGSAGDVRAQIIDFFEMDPEQVDGISLAGLVSNATQQAHALNAAAGGLGGTVISDRPRSNPRAWQGKDKAEEKPAEPEKTPADVALEQIDACTDTAELKRWWAENQEIFKDERVSAAWKAKGKSLQGKA